MPRASLPVFLPVRRSFSGRDSQFRGKGKEIDSRRQDQGKGGQGSNGTGKEHGRTRHPGSHHLGYRTGYLGGEVMPVNVTASAAKAPPVRSTANKPSGKPAPVTIADITEVRTEAVTALGSFAQLPLMLTGQYADMGAVTVHWPKISGEIAKLAATNEQIARLVDPLMQVGPYAGLITAVLPFAVQIGVNHGRIAPGAMGSVPAATLESQIKAEIAKSELHALQVQQEAEEQAARVRAEIDSARKALADGTRDQDSTNGR